MTPTFSVVIPAYNQAEFLPETIRSVLNQTFTDFEVIVVNDASPDNTTEVVRQFTDPRIHLIIHEKNKGLPGTRNTGMRATRGKYIALLDSDDLFHPQKLAVHNSFLEQHPEIGVTYNSRFELNYSDTTIRELVRPPLKVGLWDFIHGYPFTPSDMVIRKYTAETMGYFDERFTAGGEDMEYPSKLALAGCQFANVDRALNYRRHHSGRYRKNLAERLNDVQVALAEIYTNPRCPDEIRSLGETPLSEHYMVLVYLAWIQGRTAEGLKFLLDLVKMNPRVLLGAPCPVVEYFTNNSTADENDDHREILQRLFAQIPDLQVDIRGQLQLAIGRGYLNKGVRNAIWERMPAAKEHFRCAEEVGAQFSPRYLQKIAQHILNYELEMGEEASRAARERLLPFVQRLTPPADYRHFMGELYVRRAFESYARQHYSKIPNDVLNAIKNKPSLIKNRGVLSIFVKSFAKKAFDR